MAVREDGEFELVLGNKQLLSVLFIVIVLLGVFFAMGFIAGRTTGPTLARSDGGEPVSIPSIGDQAGGSSGSREPGPVTRESSDAQPSPAAAPPTAPAPESPKPAPPKPETASPRPPAAKSGFVETPAPGNYLQVAATRRADAEAMHSILTGNNLPGCITPAPRSPELIRVLVGPLADNAAVASAREKLKELGIERPYMVKY